MGAPLKISVVVFLCQQACAQYFVEIVNAIKTARFEK